MADTKNIEFSLRLEDINGLFLMGIAATTDQALGRDRQLRVDSSLPQEQAASRAALVTYHLFNNMVSAEIRNWLVNGAYAVIKAGLVGVKRSNKEPDIMTEDIEIRTTGVPAGAGVIGVERALLEMISKSPVFNTFPLPTDVEIAVENYDQVMENPFRYHMGSLYLTREEGIQKTPTTMGRLVSWVKIFRPRSSVAKSPHCMVFNSNPPEWRAEDYSDYDNEWETYCAAMKGKLQTDLSNKAADTYLEAYAPGHGGVLPNSVKYQVMKAMGASEKTIVEQMNKL